MASNPVTGEPPTPGPRDFPSTFVLGAFMPADIRAAWCFHYLTPGESARDGWPVNTYCEPKTPAHRRLFCAGCRRLALPSSPATSKETP